VIAIAAALCLSLGLAATQTVHARSSFYAYTRSEAIGAPGTLIRAEPMSGAPLSASAFKVLYRSVGLQGEPIAVSGVVVIPAGAAPAGGRPIVAWAHPTSGIVPRCAPSLAHFVFQSMPGLRELIARGDIVVATDYPGLGTAGPHPYLVGVSEGRAVLDSVRAARALPGTDAGSRFAVWGHSQGGQAALFAGMLAASYAPELDPVGVAVAAPATDLQALLREDFETDGGRNVTAMTLWSWSRVFGQSTRGVIDPQAQPAVDALADECIESVYDMVRRHYSQAPLAQHFLDVDDITAIEPWRSLLLRNIPGTLPPSLPVFIAQGDADTLVRPATTRAYMDRLCEAGSRVRMLVMPGVRHGFAGHHAAGAAVEWISQRFAGHAAPDDCAAGA
jgi:acetyl esterase/lipase